MKPARVALGTAIVALAVGVVLAVSGLPFGLVLLFAAVVAVGGALATAFVDPEEPTLPERPTLLRGGARREVGFVAWSLRSTRGRVSPGASARLRSVAQRRLARQGIDLDDPADRLRAEAVLGARAYRVVSDPMTRSFSTMRAAIRAVDHLDDGSSARPHAIAAPPVITPRSPG